MHAIADESSTYNGHASEDDAIALVSAQLDELPTDMRTRILVRLAHENGVGFSPNVETCSGNATRTDPNPAGKRRE